MIGYMYDLNCQFSDKTCIIELVLCRKEEPVTYDSCTVLKDGTETGKTGWGKKKQRIENIQLSKL